jgi:hypothetical protein
MSDMKVTIEENDASQELSTLAVNDTFVVPGDCHEVYHKYDHSSSGNVQPIGWGHLKTIDPKTRVIPVVIKEVIVVRVN